MYMSLTLTELNLYDTMKNMLYANIDVYVTRNYAPNVGLPRIEDFVLLPEIQVSHCLGF